MTRPKRNDGARNIWFALIVFNRFPHISPGLNLRIRHMQGYTALNQSTWDSQWVRRREYDCLSVAGVVPYCGIRDKYR